MTRRRTTSSSQLGRMKRQTDCRSAWRCGLRGCPWTPEKDKAQTPRASKPRPLECRRVASRRRLCRSCRGFSASLNSCVDASVSVVGVAVIPLARRLRTRRHAETCTSRLTIMPHEPIAMSGARICSVDHDANGSTWRILRPSNEKLRTTEVPMRVYMNASNQRA